MHRGFHSAISEAYHARNEKTNGKRLLAWFVKLEFADYHEEATMSNKSAPVHPGEILLEEFLMPMGISQYRLANDIGVHPRRINEIVHGNRAISADTALGCRAILACQSVSG